MVDERGCAMPSRERLVLAVFFFRSVISHQRIASIEPIVMK